MNNTKIVSHYITKNKLTLPDSYFTNEFIQRWTNHEPDTNKTILKLIDKINDIEEFCILDAGSHVGDTLFMISRYLETKNIKNVIVIGIEPDEDKFNFITDIIRLNNINNIKLYCNAVSDISGNYCINKNNINSGAWTVYNNEQGRNYISIDDVCNNKNVFLIHLDVEGYEIKALNSGKNTFKNTQHMIIEYEHVGIDEIKSILSSELYNYKIIDQGDVYIENKLFCDDNTINFENFTMVNNKHISEIQQFVHYINKNNIEGSVVECGVWKGGIIMACIKTQQKYNENRDFYLYDTFEGMTEPNSNYDLQQDKNNYRMKTEWHKIDINDVKSNISLCNYNNNRINYIKGDVIETLKSIIPNKIAILRLDTDWYESTKTELEVLYKKVSNNGFVIIDDYNNKDIHGNPRGARVACNEFFPFIKDEMKYIKPLSNEDNIPFCFQKRVVSEK